VLGLLLHALAANSQALLLIAAVSGHFTGARHESTIPTAEGGSTNRGGIRAPGWMARLTCISQRTCM
jgi:hypothetical protein